MCPGSILTTALCCRATSTGNPHPQLQSRGWQPAVNCRTRSPRLTQRSRAGFRVSAGGSEYQLARVTEIGVLRELVQAGDVRFILASSLMRFMDLELYTWLQANTLEVSLQAGLPLRDEMQLLEVVVW